MKIKAGLFAVVVAIAAAAFFVNRDKSTQPIVETAAAKSAATGDTTKLAASAVLKIDPKVRSVSSAPLMAPKVTASADTLQYRDKKDWPQLYQRLKNGPPTAESQFLQAELLDRCAKRPPPTDGKPAPDSREVRREKFVKSLAGTEAQKTARLTAYDALNIDSCGELRAIDYVKEDVARLRKAAAEAGDIRARARQISEDIYKASDEFGKPRTDGTMPDSGFVITDAQWAGMREVLASGDPGAMEMLRGIMASTLTDGSIRLGPDKEPIDNRAFWNALGLAACDLGKPCGADSAELLAACAQRNQCGSASVQDHAYYYEASPHTAQLVERYRQTIADMIRSGNFDNLNLVRGTRDGSNTFIFRGR
jgi:hypothetical protein